jgi:hypothetical protein
MCRSLLGGSFLDYFIFFQAFGFFGLLALWRMFDEIRLWFGVDPSANAYWLLFLPSLHFWTSAVGKDAPLFFAICLASWSALSLSRRCLYFAFALLVMMLFRPHIALAAGIAAVVSTALDHRSTGLARLLLFVVAAVGTIYLATTVEATFHVNVADADSISSFFERQHQIGMENTAATGVKDAPYVIRLISLLFRPFFFDANGLLAIISSIENLIFLLIVFYFVRRRSLLKEAIRAVPGLRFAWIFGMGLTLLLAQVYYNVGLGARQKTMILPPLLALFFAQIAFRQLQVLVSKVSPRMELEQNHAMVTARTRSAKAAGDEQVLGTRREL